MSDIYDIKKGEPIFSEEERITISAKLEGEGFGAFPEQPPVDIDHTDRRLVPHHLFSLFTAGIIEQKVVFTR